MPSMLEHKQAIARGCRPDGSKFKIRCDEKIVGLIAKLNEAGARTLFSCQDLNRSNCIQVIFDRSSSRKTLMKALAIMARRYPKRKLILSSNAYFDPEVIAALPSSDLSKVCLGFWSWTWSAKDKMPTIDGHLEADKIEEEKVG